MGEAGNERKGFFSQEEFDRARCHLPRDLADFALFGYLTGWRKGDIASLTWQDVEDGIIRLRGKNAKNGEARSVVIAGELSALFERREQVRLVNGILTDRVFHRSGAEIRNFREAWISAGVAAGLGKMVCYRVWRGKRRQKVRTKYSGRLFHDFRRTGLRNRIRFGRPSEHSDEDQRHKTASMFRRHDTCEEDDLRAAVESVARYRESQAKASKVVNFENIAAKAKVSKGDNLRTRTSCTKKGPS